ncbi:MAG: hypothetical protein AB1894_10855 [Chloroflexota bacterium]
MRKNHPYPYSRSICSKLLVISLGLLLVAGLMSCDSLIRPGNPTLRETQLELSVQQTLAVQRSTDQVLEKTRQAGQPTLPVPEHLTQQAPEATIDPNQAAEATVQAMQATQAVEITSSAPLATTEPPPPVGDLATMAKSANILLFEDMIGNLDTNRYIKDTLTALGVPCEQDGSTPCRDVGSAQGWLKEQLAGGAPGGKPWDVIIVASESKKGTAELKSSFPAEYTEGILEAIDQGSSVILEMGNLDSLHAGVVGTMAARCGIEYENNWVRVPASRMVMFSLDPTNPIFNEPNNDMSFTATTSYWTTTAKGKYYDIGDLVALGRGGDATLLLGTTPDEKTRNGTLTVCMNGQLLWQTFSSHQLAYKSMQLVWENYIYHALKVRFSRAP